LVISSPITRRKKRMGFQCDEREQLVHIVWEKKRVKMEKKFALGSTQEPAKARRSKKGIGVGRE